LLLVVIAFYKNNNSTTINVEIFIDDDTLGTSFASIFIFQEGYVVVDTYADMDGRITISQKINKLIVDYSGCYPKHVSMDVLKTDSIIRLKSSIILSESYPSVDTVLNLMNEEVQKEVESWNSKYKKD
jgi:hypothetical protein